MTEHQNLNKALTDEFVVPLSPVQQRIWSLDQARKGDRSLNGAFRLAVDGPLDPNLLEQALNALIARHEILRATCREIDGAPMLIVAEHLVTKLGLRDLSHVPADEGAAEVERLCTREAEERFDLARGPLIRLGLIRLAADRHILTLTLHHMICDGWSIRQLIEELVVLYKALLRNEQPPLARLDIQFADYVAWLDDYLESAEIKDQLAYWGRKLKDFHPLELLPDVAGPNRTDLDARIVAHELPVPVVEGLKRFSDAQGGTMFMTTLAAFMALLRQETGRDDVGVVSPVAGRHRVETESIIGPLLNTLLLRATIAEAAAFRDVERAVRETVLEAFANQDAPFELVAKAMGWAEDQSRDASGPSHPAGHINFMCYRGYAGGHKFVHDLGDAKMRTLPSPSQGALYDLNVFIVERETGWRLSLEYRTSLYSAERAQRLVDRYLSILERIAASPDIKLSELAPAAVADSIAASSDAEPNMPQTSAAEADTEETFVLPASLAQERFWLLHKAAPQAGTFNIPAAVRVGGALRIETLTESINRLIARHESLRTTFEEENASLVQVIAPRLTISVVQTNLAELPAGDREGGLNARLLEEARAPFDLTRGPLIRAHLFQMADRDHALMITMPHAISDGQSITVLQRELWSIYEALEAGREPDLAPMTLQYGDFAAWQQEWISSAAAAEQLAYWKDKLRSPLPIANFPLDDTPRGRPGSRASVETTSLPTELAAKLRKRAQGENATMFMLTSAAFAILLARYSGQYDVLFGCPMANRSADTEAMIGPFSGPLALRLDLTGNPTLGEAFIRARDTMVDALARGDLPFERLYKELRVRSVSGRNPLFQFYFGYQTAFLQPRRIEGLTIEPIPDMNVGTPYELQLTLIERPAGIAIKLAHDLDLLTADGARDILAYYLRILEAMADASDMAIAELPAPARTAASQPITSEPAIAAAAYVAPTTEEEQRLALIWQELLGVPRVGVEDDFFELGGQSLLAAQLIDAIEKTFNVAINLSELAALRTVKELAGRLTAPVMGRWGKIVSLQPNGAKPPLYCIHGTDNILYFLDLARAVPKDQPVYGLPAPQLDHALSSSSIGEMAAYYTKEIRAMQPKGPYNLCGYSAGTLISYEIATLLQQAGEEVDRLILIDTSNPLYYQSLDFKRWLYFWTTRLANRYGERFSLARPGELLTRIAAAVYRRASRLAVRQVPVAALAQETTGELVQNDLAALETLARDYRPRPFYGEVIVFRSMQDPEYDVNPTMGWDQLATKGVKVLRVGSDHLAIMHKPYVEHLARLAFPQG